MRPITYKEYLELLPIHLEAAIEKYKANPSPLLEKKVKDLERLNKEHLGKYQI